MTDTKGGIGSEIANYYYNEDYLSKLNDFRTRAIEYQKMSDSDPVVNGLLTAVKNPILNASWNFDFKDIEILDDKQKKMIDYLNIVFFEDLRFKDQKLYEVMTFVEHGYSIFAKNFYRKESKEIGEYITVDLPIRLQKTILGFKFNDLSDPDLITHIQQVFSNVRTVNVDIPIDDLLTFTVKKVGNDLTGKSLLRSCYKPYMQKDLTEKLKMIGIEKYAIGTVNISYPENNDKEIIKELKKAGRAYMGHEKAIFVRPADYGITIIKGEFDDQAILKSIEQNNTEMALSFLAQFLFLGQNEKGGAYALGQDQSDFFLNTLDYIASIVRMGMNKIAWRLIDLQFGEQKEYPELFCKGINSKSTKEMAETLKVLVEAGYIIPDRRIQTFVRDLYKLPPMPDETEEDKLIEQKKPGKTIEEKETIIEDKEKGEKEIIKKEKIEKENVDTNEKENENNKKMSTIQLQDAPLSNVRYKDNLFQRGITANEKFIQQAYNDRYIPLVSELEDKVKVILTNGYSKAKKEMREGVEYITTSGNSGIKNDTKSKLRDQFKKFKERIFSKRYSDFIMNGAQKNADSLMGEFYDVTMAFVSQSEYNSYMAGHKSNMEAVVFNEERHILEDLEANFGQGLNMKVISDQISLYKINGNTFKLSVTAHPRGLFRGEVLKSAQNKGINNFKMMIPRGIKLDKAGETIANIYLIRTLYEWEKKQAARKDGAGTVGGLGLHYNSMDYYEPIAADELPMAQSLSREQRQELDKLIKTK